MFSRSLKPMVNSGSIWFSIWVLAQISMITLGFLEDLDKVPNTPDNLIIWPFTSIEGALWACTIWILFKPMPTTRQIVGLIWGGSAAFIAVKQINLEASDLLRFTTYFMAVPLLGLCILRSKRSMLRVMGLLAIIIFGGFAYFTHTALMFPVFEEVDRQRKEVVSQIVNSKDPTTQGACGSKGIRCFTWEDYSSTTSQIQLKMDDKEVDVIRSVYEKSPIYSSLHFRIVGDNVFNKDTDYTLLSMISHDGKLAIVRSSEEHLIEWRVVMNRYLMTAISTAYLVWFTLLYGVGLTHTYMIEKRRKKANMGAQNVR